MTKQAASKTAPATEPTPAKAKATVLAKGNNFGMTKPQLAKINAFETVSDRIRFLNSEGYTRSQIAACLTAHRGRLVRYQHVRNVLITPVAQPKKS